VLVARQQELDDGDQPDQREDAGQDDPRDREQQVDVSPHERKTIATARVLRVLLKLR